MGSIGILNTVVDHGGSVPSVAVVSSDYRRMTFNRLVRVIRPLTSCRRSPT
jgi:hypothetical protein